MSQTLILGSEQGEKRCEYIRTATTATIIAQDSNSKVTMLMRRGKGVGKAGTALFTCCRGTR